MRLIDISGNALLVNGFGSASGATNSPNVLLSAWDPLASVLFRSGSTTYAQILGLGTNANDGILYFDAAQGFRFRTVLHGPNARLTINDNGKVGIGTNVPKSILSVENGSAPGADIPLDFAGLFSGSGSLNRLACADGNKVVYLDVIGSNNYAELSTIIYPTYQPFNLILNANGGNVGIGTTSPNARLQVNGGEVRVVAASADSTKLTLYDNGGNTGARSWGWKTNDVTWGNLVLYESATQGGDPFAGHARVTFFSGGDVSLENNKSLQWKNNSGGIGGAFIRYDNFNQILIGAGGTPRWVMTDGGNLYPAGPSQTLGAQSSPVAHIYAANLSISGTSSFQDDVAVDGTLSSVGGVFSGQVTVGSDLSLINQSRNTISFYPAGAAPPAFSIQSAGTKLALYPSLSGSSADYALGYETGALWFSTATTSNSFKWYGGTTLGMSLTGGILNVQNGLTVNGAGSAGALLRGDGSKFTSFDPGQRWATNSLITSNGSATQILNVDLASNNNGATAWEVIVVAYDRTSTNHGYSFRQSGLLVRNGSTDAYIERGAEETETAGSGATFAVSVDKAASTPDYITVTVTGTASYTIVWRAVIKWSYVPQS